MNYKIYSGNTNTILIVKGGRDYVSTQKFGEK